MKGLGIGLLLGVGALFGQSGEELVKRFGYLNPEFSFEGLDYSRLTQISDSTVYFYHDTIHRLDSSHQMYQMGVPQPEMRKTTFRYIKTKQGRGEREILVDMKTGVVIMDESRVYDKEDKLFQRLTKSEVLRKTTTAYTYDKMGNRIGQIDLNYEDKVVADYAFEYDKKNRRVKWINKSYSNGRYRKYYYSDFDSLTAETNVFPEEKREELVTAVFYDKSHLRRKYIKYAYEGERPPPLLVAYHRYDSKRRLTETFMFQWMDTDKPWRQEDMVFRRHETYEYDSRGRLQRKVFRDRPVDEWLDD